MFRYWFLAIVLIGGGVFPAAAQEYSYVNYTVKDGLAGSTVYAMVRDKDGFLWFGTETGLSRFDGLHFRNFSMSDGLPDNEIIKLFVDSPGRVWIIPFKNSICYYRNGRIHNQQNDSLLRRLNIRSEVVSVREDGHGNLIIAESKIIHIINATGQVTDIDQIGRHPFSVIQVGINDNGDCRLILDMYKIGQGFVNLEQGRLVLAPGTTLPGPNMYTTTLIGPGLEAYARKDSLFLLHTREKRASLVCLPKGFIDVSRLNDSSVMLNAYSFTYLYNIHQDKIVDSFLPGQVVNGVLEDPEGGLWFSTLGGGLHRLMTRDIIHYSLREGNTVFPVFSIRRVGSRLYVGTDRFYLWSRSDGEQVFHPQVIDDLMTRGRINALEDAGDGGVLAGTDAGVLEPRMPIKNSHPVWWRESVKALCRIADSSVIEFSATGVMKLRVRDNRLLDEIWPGRATCGWVDGDQCYIGTLTGLYVTSLHEKKDIKELVTGRIAAISAAPDGGLWVATNGRGLLLLKNGVIAKRITIEDGLTSNICRCLAVAGKSIWVGTDKGLNRITLTDSGPAIRCFTAADGISPEIINAVYVEGTKVYAGTADGIIQFHDDRVLHRSDCWLRMTGISVGGNSWPLDTTNFTLPFRNNDLQVEYVGISYRSGATIRYRYRLLGSDDHWGTTDLGILHYPSLPPGKYELQILAINPSGAISGALRLPFSIDTPWWQEVWVRIVSALAMGGLIWLLFNRRVKTIRQKEAEKTATAARMAELEQMALRSRMNPHFIFNSLNSIQLFVMEKDIRGANEYITHFSRLIRQTLDISARATLSLQEEIDYLSTYLELEKRRFEGAFDYTIFVAPNIDRRGQTLPPMILQPYVENAVLHGIAHRKDGLGRISVGFQTDSHHLICTIEDNGVGRERAAQYKRQGKMQYPSRGMELTARRIDILNSAMKEPISAVIEDISEADRRAEGTRVIVRFPLAT